MRIILITSLLTTSLFLVSVPKVYAAGNFYLSPASKSVSQGSGFAVAIRVNSPNPINAVQANLSYPTDKLDFVSISTSGTAFDLQVESSGGGGSVRIARGLIGTTSGDKLIVTVTFRAKVNSGSGVISFAGGTQAVDSTGGAVVVANSGGTYTFTTPPPAATLPPADTTAPKISDVKVVKTTLDSAAISWKTDEASTSIVDYGTEKGYFLTTEKADLVTAHEVTINSKFLRPAATYHFQARSKDAAGNEVKSADSIFRTAGYTLRVTILGNDGKPLNKVKATIYSTSKTSSTDRNGLVEFTDVTPGKHVLATEVNGKLFNNEIEVKETGPTQVKSKDKNGKDVVEVKVEPQEFTVKLAGVSSQNDFITLFGLILIILGVLAVGFLIYRRTHKQQVVQPLSK